MISNVFLVFLDHSAIFVAFGAAAKNLNGALEKLRQIVLEQPVSDMKRIRKIASNKTENRQFQLPYFSTSTVLHRGARRMHIYDIVAYRPRFLDMKVT